MPNRSSGPGSSITLGGLFVLDALESHDGLWELQAALGTQMEPLGSPEQLGQKRDVPAPCLCHIFPPRNRERAEPPVTSSVWGRHSAQMHRLGGGGGGHTDQVYLNGKLTRLCQQQEVSQQAL